MSIYEEDSELKLRELTEKVRRLERENLEMSILIEEAGLSLVENKLSEAEYICLSQLRMLKEQAELRPLDKEEVNMLDVFHKNLLMSRNIPIVKKSKEKKKSPEELLRIINSPTK